MKIQRHLNFLWFAVNSIFTYKTRTIAITFSLMMALMILGSVAFVSGGLEKEAILSATFAPDITVQYLQAGRQIPISMNNTGVINKISGVEKTIPRVWGYISQNNRIYTIMGIDPAEMPIPKEINFAISSGRFLQVQDSEVAIVGRHLAAAFALDVDDTLILYNESGHPYNFTVVGVFTMEVNLYAADLILVTVNDSRKFFGITENYATDLCVYASDQTETRYIAQQILNDIPGARVLTRQALKDALLSAYGARSGFVSVIWYIMLLAVILVAWNQASAVSAEARKEVGILKSLGFSTMDILEIRLLEAIILGVLSASLGILLAIIYDLYLGAPVISDFMLGWAAVYPSFPLPIHVSVTSVVILYGVAIFPLLVGSLVPSWKSAITEPDTAMRGG